MKFLKFCCADAEAVPCVVIPAVPQIPYPFLRYAYCAECFYVPDINEIQCLKLKQQIFSPRARHVTERAKNNDCDVSRV